MTNMTVHVLVPACPYERIAEFGFKLRSFAEMCPTARFTWHQVDEDDQEAQEVEDDQEDYRGDPNWVIFAVNFRRQVHAAAYRAWLEEGTLLQSHRPTCTSDVAVADEADDRVWTLQIGSDDPRAPDAITHYATEKDVLEARREFLIEWLAESFEATGDPRDPAELNDGELLAEWKAEAGERYIEIRCSHVQP
jgi:hypothetical protein